MKTGGRCHAFTLMEVVLALALGAMLMVALVGVLRSTSRQLQQARPVSQANCDTAFRVISRDLLLAQTIAVKDGWIDLTGSFPEFGSEDTHARKVAYGIAAAVNGDETVLMRVTEHGGQSIAPQITRIDIERLDSTGTPQPLSSQASSLAGAVRVWLWDADVGRPTLERDVVVH